MEVLGKIFKRGDQAAITAVAAHLEDSNCNVRHTAVEVGLVFKIVGNLDQDLVKSTDLVQDGSIGDALTEVLAGLLGGPHATGRGGCVLGGLRNHDGRGPE